MGSAHIFASLSVVNGENLGRDRLGCGYLLIRGRLDCGGQYNK